MTPPPALSLGLGWLALSSQSVGLGGIPLSQSDFTDFCEHGPRMRFDDFHAVYGELIARAPTSVFPRGSSRILTSSMQAASNLVASVFVVPVAPPVAPAGDDHKTIFPAPAQPIAPLASAGVRQKSPFPEPAQPEAPNLSTTALEITPSTPAAQPGSVGVGTDNVPSTPTNPHLFFHSEASDVDS